MQVGSEIKGMRLPVDGVGSVHGLGSVVFFRGIEYQNVSYLWDQGSQFSVQK